jgi:hypothetical protein
LSISPYLVSISDIACTFSGKFDINHLHRAAKLIISSGGVINPLVLRQTGFSCYEVVDGVFEYYAAVEAKKLDPMRGESINAYIIQPGQEQIMADQIALFRKNAEYKPVELANMQAMDQFLEILLRQFEAVLNPQLNEIKSQLNELKTQFNTLEGRLELRPISVGFAPDAVDVSAMPHVVETVLQPYSGIIQSKIDQQEQIPAVSQCTELPTKEDALIHFLNAASDKVIKSLKAGITTDALSHFIAQRKQGPFLSKQDLLSRMKGKRFTETTYSNLLDGWQATLPRDQDKRPNTLPASQAPSDCQSYVAPFEETPTISIAPVIEVDAPLNINPIIAAEAVMQPTLALDPSMPPVAVDASPAAPVKVVLRGIDKLNNMSVPELAVTLSRLKINEKLRNALLEQRPFESFDAINIKGIGATIRQRLAKAFE